jgi:hypothetical protein
LSKIASTALVVGWGLCGRLRALPQRARRRLILLLFALIIFGVGVIVRITTLMDIAVALAVELAATGFTTRSALKWANDRGSDDD